MKSRYGLILIDKNEGYTSNDTVRLIGRKLGVKKVGHTGTLDKFASGLLICLAGSFTRLSNYLVSQNKSYEALIEFGKETSTLDPEGEVTAESAPPGLDALENVVPDFMGEIDQVPPRYSAVHIDGKRAYQRTRSGEDVDMPSRKVRIDDLELLDYQEPFLRLRLSCSKGTYVRSLARDLARAAGSVGYVKSLRRLSVGTALVEDAADPAAVDADTDLINDKGRLDQLLGIQSVTIPGPYDAAFLDGRQFPAELLGEAGKLEGPVICFDEDERLLGVVERTADRIRYGMVNGALRD